MSSTQVVPSPHLTRTLTFPKTAAAVALFVVAAVVLMTQAYNPFIYFIF